ncbi:MAG TPA: type IV pilus twitching motility protein PilT [Armatimonadota bacterium]|jgi:twitching motility protein PilT
MAELDLDKLLTFCVQQGGSDMILKSGTPPIIRLHGDLVRMKLEAISREETKRLAYQVLDEEQVQHFEDRWELDFAYEIVGVARFRCNMMIQRGLITAIYRVIPYRIKSIEELGLPEICYRLADHPRGLVLVTGPTGSGKSTTLAAMVDYVNRTKPVHIMTVEDPLEFIHEDKRAVINQRELGRDTVSFADALKYVLRQDPDVILIGEMRDLETIGLAITAAETGHLVFGTLHTTNAVQTVDRVIDVFPPHQQQQVRMQMSVNLVGVLSQVLCKTSDGHGRVAAFETMEATPAIRNLVREGKTHQIGSNIQTGSKRGMYSLDQSLAALVADGRAEYESALTKVNDVIDFEEVLAKLRADKAAARA